MVDNQAVARIIARVGELPAMPVVVSEVLRVSNDPSLDMERLSNTIQGDPALTAKILRISNSPYYGMKQYVGTLKLALVILGVREVRNIVLGISVFATLKSEKSDIEMTRRIWENSLQIAGLAKKLGEDVGLGLQGEEFIVGLLSDIGKMVLLRAWGADYCAILENLNLDSPALCEAELREMGCSHADLAMALASSWNLPQSLIDALWCQYAHLERPVNEASHPGLAAVLRLSKRALLDDFSNPSGVMVLQDKEAWDALDSAKKPIPEALRYATLCRYVEEIKRASKTSMWLW